MQRCIVLSVIAIMMSGCEGSRHQRKVFETSDLHLGMQKFEVEQICNGSMELISSELIPDSNGCSKTVYRMWPNETKTPIGIRCVSDTPSAVWAGGKYIKPYQLTFIGYPPITKEQLVQIAKTKNITEPNEIKTLMLLEGFRPNELVNISLDTEALNMQTAEYQQNVKNVQSLSYQRQTPAPQPVIIQQSPQISNPNYWQEQRAQQEYWNEYRKNLRYNGR